MKLNYLVVFLLITTLANAQNIPQKGNLGVNLGPAPENDYGAIYSIAALTENSTAASLDLQPNDVLVELNGTLFDHKDRISEVIGQFVVGNKVTAKVLRNGSLVPLKGTVKAAPPFKKANHEIELLEVPFRDGYVRAYLSRPKGKGPFPTIYYLQGYPCQSINSHPQHPVLQLTAGLVDLGYAVFRIEKPGVGEFANLASCMDYSYDDEVENFKGGLSFLQKLKHVDAANIYLFGHSLGGNVAPMLAKEAELAGVMVFGTLVKPWEDYLVDMAYYSQTQTQDAVEVAENISLLKSANRKLYVDNLPHNQLTDQEKALLSNWHNYDPVGTIFNRTVDFWKNFSRHNYMQEWAQVKAPVLAMYGESDAHAIGPLDTELIAQVVNQHHEGYASFQLVPETNHLFAKVPSRVQELDNINSGRSAQVAYTQFNVQLPLIVDNWIKTGKQKASQQKFDLASLEFPKAATKMSSMDVQAADLNQDGYDDLIIATEFGPNQLFLFKDGKWEPHTLPQLKQYTPPYLGEDSEDIAIADFDNDGDLDLFFVSEDTNDHELLWNDGQGNFSFPDFQIIKKGQANAVLVYDFNQDGWQDILIGIRGQNELYLNDKGKGFTDGTANYWLNNEDHTQDLVLVDIDGDQDLDILEGIEAGDNNLYVNENGKFVAQSKRLPLPAEMETRKIVATDFDQDGDMDLFYCNVGWNPVKNPQNQLLLNDGKGHFTNVTEWLPDDYATTLDAAFIDLNDDGNLDLITTNFVNDRKVKVFLGKRAKNQYTFEEHFGLLPNINFYGGTSVLPLKVNKKEYLYFANFKSEDILLKKKS